MRHCMSPCTRRLLTPVSRTLSPQEPSAEKQAAVAHVLGLSDSEAASLKDVVSSGAFKMEEMEEEAIF